MAEPTTVYVVINQDTHYDTEVDVFADASTALAHARETVQEALRHPEDLNEDLTEGMQRAGWLYHARYSPEGDTVRVMPRELHIPDQALYALVSRGYLAELEAAAERNATALVYLSDSDTPYGTTVRIASVRERLIGD